MLHAFRIGHNDAISIDIAYMAVFLGNHYYAAVVGRLVLHTGADIGGLGLDERDGLTLHVGAHQGTVGIVVLQEGDHSGSNGNHHLGGNIHVVHLVAGDLLDAVAVPDGNLFVDKMAVFIQRLIGLRHDVFIFHIGGHILDGIQHLAGGLIYRAVGGLHKAVLIDAGKGGKVRDQTNVGTFRGLDGAHAAVVAVMHIADLKSGTVTTEAAGAQGGKTALVGQLGQGVGLVHELAQGGGTKEFLDRCHNGTAVDDGLQGDGFNILGLCGHSLPNDALHAGKADAELVLQQLAHAADAAVAQVVDIIGGAEIVPEAAHVVDGGVNIKFADVLGDQLIGAAGQLFGHFLAGKAHIQDLGKDGKTHSFPDAHGLQLFGGVVGKVGHIHHTVGEDLQLLHPIVLGHLQAGGGQALGGDPDGINAVGLQQAGVVAAQQGAGLKEDLAGAGIGHGAGKHLAGDAGHQGELFVVLVAAHPGKIIAAGIKQQLSEVLHGRFDGGGLAGTQLAVNLQQGLIAQHFGILAFGGLYQVGIAAKHLVDLLIGAAQVGQGVIHIGIDLLDGDIIPQAQQRPDKGGDRQLAVFIDADAEHIGGVGIILQPGAAVGDHGGIKQFFAGGIVVHAIIDTGRTHQLGDDDTLGTIDDEGAGIGHQGEISHVDVGFLDLASDLVDEPRTHAQGGGIVYIPLLALQQGVLWFVIQRKINEIQLQIALIVGDRGDVLEYGPKTLIQEPLIGIFLYFDEVRHLGHFIDVGKALADIFAQFYGFGVYHPMFHSIPSFFRHHLDINDCINIC